MTTDTASRADRFVSYLEELVGPDRAQPRERGTLAQLRRGAGKQPGEATEAVRHIMRFDPPVYDTDAYFLVGTLFALHPLSWQRGEGDRRNHNLGASLAWLGRERPEQVVGIERRFTALLNSRREELPTRLRHVIGLLRGEEILVDWRQLLTDLRGWEHPDRYTQLAWARAFWGAGAGDATTADAATSGSDNNDDNDNRKDDDQ